MKGLILGWVFAATFYTCLDVTIKIHTLYENDSNYIIYAGLLVNALINYCALGVLRRKNPWHGLGG